jgi:hypothetical protein
MADQTEQREPLTNVGALNAAIVSAFHEVRTLDQDIAEMTEVHVKPLKDQRVKLMRELKADTTIEQADVTLFYRIWSRQEDARNILEEEDRDRVLDNLRTLFVALNSGAMLDFIDVLETTGSQHTPAHIQAAEDQREVVAEEEAEEEAAAPPPATEPKEPPEPAKPAMAAQVKRGAASR